MVNDVEPDVLGDTLAWETERLNVVDHNSFDKRTTGDLQRMRQRHVFLRSLRNMASNLCQHNSSINRRWRWWRRQCCSWDPDNFGRRNPSSGPEPQGWHATPLLRHDHAPIRHHNDH